MYLNPRHFVAQEGAAKEGKPSRLCKKLQLFGVVF